MALVRSPVRDGGSAIACVLACLAVVVPSAAAAGFDVGPGLNPDVAIGPDGTAHIAWNSADLHSVSYCRITPASDTCAPAAMPVSDNGFARPYVFASGSTVQLLTNRCCANGSKTLLFNSGDAGQTFGPASVIGTLNPSGDAARGPGNGFSVVTTGLISTYFQLAPGDGGSATTELPLSNQYTYNGTVAIVDDRPLVVFDDLTRTAFTRSNGGDPSAGTSWPAPTVIGDGVEPHLAPGPAGLFLLTRKERALLLWKFDGSGFAPAGTVNQAANPIGPASIAQDSAGHLHVAWREGSGNPTTLMYTSSADGATWSVPLPLAEDSNIQDLRLAVGADGHGIATWDRGSAENMVRAVRVPPPARPRPSFTYAPHGICAGLISFDASGSQPAAAPIVSYHWVIHDVKTVWTGIWSPEKRAMLEPDDHVIDSGTNPRTSWRFQWRWESLGLDTRIVRPPAAVDLIVTDAEGLTAMTTVTVHFLYDEGTLGRDCPAQVDTVGPIRVASTASVGVAGDVAVVVGCPSGSPICVGSLMFRRLGSRSSADAARRRPRGALLARTRFAVPPGRRGVLHVQLNRRGRALMRRHKTLRVRAVSTTTAYGSKAKPRSFTLKLTRRARRSR